MYEGKEGVLPLPSQTLVAATCAQMARHRPHRMHMAHRIIYRTAYDAIHTL